jgi:hypothetical protein
MYSVRARSVEEKTSLEANLTPIEANSYKKTVYRFDRQFFVVPFDELT